jgi:hypothetical protein
MTKYPGGWNDLEITRPMNITDAIAYAGLFNGTTEFAGAVANSTTFHKPSGAGWAASPILLNAEPTLLAVNAAFFVNEAQIAAAINMQTKMAKLDAPYNLKNMVYLYGNPENDLKYQMTIPLDLGGASNYKVQIGVYENIVINNDVQKVVEAIDWGTQTFQNVNTLRIMFANYFGQLNIGVRLESSANVSSMFELKAYILPVKTV